MPVSVGPTELIIVLVIALIVLGPKKLPEVGRSVGNGMREFKDSLSGINATTTTRTTSPSRSARPPRRPSSALACGSRASCSTSRRPRARGRAERVLRA